MPVASLTTFIFTPVLRFFIYLFLHSSSHIFEAGRGAVSPFPPLCGQGRDRPSRKPVQCTILYIPRGAIHCMFFDFIN